MIGAIIGDIFGSIYEFDNFKPGNRNDIDFFDETQKSIHYTDDTVMTIAIADAILNDKDINQTLKEWFSYYPEESYGGGFRDWCKARDDRSNDSCGNGSAMRVSSIGWLANSIEEVMKLAKKSCLGSHNHIEGIKGAQAIAVAIYLARTKHSKTQIKEEIEKRFDYDLNPLKLDDLKHSNHFNSTCMDTVPEAILCFLESTNYQDCIKLAISVGGDTDTMCCIAGGIAEAFYPRVTNGRGIPRFMLARTYNKLDQRMKKILSQFFAYINGNRPAQEDQYSEESFIEARKRWE